MLIGKKNKFRWPKRGRNIFWLFGIFNLRIFLFLICVFSLLFLSALVCVPSAFIRVAYAWTEPTEAPPGGNVLPPLNAGPTNQYKTGNITIGTSSVNNDHQLYVSGKTNVTGNIAIGTSSANSTYQLYISGEKASGDASLKLYAPAGSSAVLYLQGNAGTAAAAIRQAGNNELQFLTNATPRMTISSDGNVGIGVTGPQGKLVVMDGNVGIGTTAPNNLLEVKDLISFKNSDWKTLIGYEAGKNDVAQYNTYIGYQAGYGGASSTSEADYNTALGYQALYSNTTGYANNAIGYQALRSNTTGDYNNALGYYALYINTNGARNNALGYETLYSNTYGSNNNALGYQALHSNTEGNANNALGYQALYSNTTGYHNNALGYQALWSNTSGRYNNALGYAALYKSTGCTDNNALGYAALYENTTGHDNNALGHQTLYSNTTGSNNNAIGDGALYKNIDGSNNNAIGNRALYSNTTGYHNNALGHQTLHSNTTGYHNNALGYEALYSNTTGYHNNALGSTALHRNTIGRFNNAIGDGALYWNTEGEYNNALGYGALYSNNTGKDNNAMGHDALHSNSTGKDNNALGHEALRYNSTGENNNAIGYGALRSNNTGSYNNVLGAGALYSATGNYNIAIGENAGRYLANGATANTKSNYSIYLGSNTKALADDDQNEIVIGYNATGLGSNTVVLGNDSITKTALKGNVGIGTTGPQYKLDVRGTGAAGQINAQAGLCINGDCKTSWSDLVGYWAASGDDIYNTNSGNVGIGTTGPNRKLHVYDTTVNAEINLQSVAGANNHWAFYHDSTSDDLRFWKDSADRVTFTDDGNVGIGVTSPNGKLNVDYGSGSGPGVIIQGGGSVFENIALRLWDIGQGADNINILEFGHNSSYVPGARIKSVNPEQYATTGAHLILETASDNAGTWNSNQLVLNRNGNVGIGVTNPSYKLDVVNDSRIQGNLFLGGDKGIFGGSAGSGVLSQNLIKFATDNSIVIGNSGQGIATPIRFFSSASEKLRITNEGNVGIGTTGPQYKLDVRGEGAAGQINAEGGLCINGDCKTSWSGLTSYWSANGNDIYNNNTGNVGIGTTGPSAHLTVQNDFARFRVETTTGPDGYYFEVQQNYSYATPLQIIARGGGSIDTLLRYKDFANPTDGGLFFIGDKVSMLYQSGNVGIGTTGPKNKLDIEGGLAVGATYSGTYTAPSNGMIIEGNVGIGTTAPNNLLEVKDLISFKNSGQKTLIGYQAGKYSVALAQYNTYIGYQAGYGSTNTTFKADYNTALGYQALYSDTTGKFNNAIGYLALFSNTEGDSNNALGYEALYSNTTGGGNNAIGYHALYSNTTGYNNNALGHAALSHTTEGQGNNAIGGSALSLNTTGSNNNALGFYALSLNTTGSNNNALGYYALSENTTGSYNIAIGAEAGRYIANGSTANTTSDYSIYLGSNTKALADDDQNEIVIGYNATGLGSNTVVLGNDSITKTALKGNVGIGTTGPNRKLHVYDTSTNAEIDLQSVAGANKHWALYHDATSNDLRFWKKSADLVTFTDEGNVGIGTTGPQAKLHVYGSNGIVKGDAGFQLGELTSQPTCNSSTEGKMIYRSSTTCKGTDTACQYFEICMQTGSSSYTWQEIKYTGWGGSGT